MNGEKPGEEDEGGESANLGFGSPRRRSMGTPSCSPRAAAPTGYSVAANLFGASPSHSHDEDALSPSPVPARKRHSPRSAGREALAEVHTNRLDITDDPQDPDRAHNRTFSPPNRVHVLGSQPASGCNSSPLPPGTHVEPIIRSTMDPEHNVPMVEPHTVAHLLNQSNRFEMYIVDCRYPYEFDGGHIRGATNVYEPTEMASLLRQLQGKGTQVAIVLHCEYSTQRAPRMFRHVRNSDRKAHMADYPRLTFPHVYVLSGGYKAFVQEWPSLCTPPNAYTAMHESGYERQLKRYNERQRMVWQQWPKDLPAW